MGKELGRVLSRKKELLEEESFVFRCANGVAVNITTSIPLGFFFLNWCKDFLLNFVLDIKPFSQTRT